MGFSIVGVSCEENYGYCYVGLFVRAILNYCHIIGSAGKYVLLHFNVEGICLIFPDVYAWLGLTLFRLVFSDECIQ